MTDERTERERRLLIGAAPRGCETVHGGGVMEGEAVRANAKVHVALLTEPTGEREPPNVLDPIDRPGLDLTGYGESERGLQSAFMAGVRAGVNNAGDPHADPMDAFREYRRRHPEPERGEGALVPHDFSGCHVGDVLAALDGYWPDGGSYAPPADEHRFIVPAAVLRSLAAPQDATGEEGDDAV